MRKENDVPFVDTKELREVERLPGWKGRYVHTGSMTVAHYEFSRGAAIHEHSHAEEEIYEILEGEVEITIGGEVRIARPGIVAIIPSNTRHAVKALSDGQLIVVDHPARPEFG